MSARHPTPAWLQLDARESGTRPLAKFSASHIPRRVDFDERNSMTRHDKPIWSGRVPRNMIARLYECDAQGIIDEELIDEVGIALLARIDSISRSKEVRSGSVLCPLCGSSIPREGHTKGEILRCEPCDWELSWGEYFKTIQGKHLLAHGVRAFLTDYAREYPRAKSARGKMILIDTLIHCFHGELKGKLNAPGARDLIGGKPRDILDFLNRLTYGDQSTTELQITRADFEEKQRRRRESGERRRAERKVRNDAKRKRDEAKARYKALTRESGLSDRGPT